MMVEVDMKLYVGCIFCKGLVSKVYFICILYDPVPEAYLLHQGNDRQLDLYM